MKKNIHPPLHPVVFVDLSAGARFRSRSTMTSGQTEIVDGVEHYIVHIGISSASHPFYTGQNAFVDVEGRIDKFTKRYGASRIPRVQKLKDRK